MANLVLTAENFAFGPIAKLLFVADLLVGHGHRLVFVGFGTSLQLAKSFPFDEIHKIDTDNPDFNRELENIISKADMVISSMELNSVIVAKRLKKPVVWIDCLFWFWKSIFEPVLDVDLYVREISMEDSSNEIKFGSIIKNLFNVGPILGKTRRTKRLRQALVSYGGGEATHWYKVGRDTNYPYILTKILSKYVDWSYFDQVIVTTGEHIVKELKERFPETSFKFMCLPHKRFIKELLQSEILFTTAGLVTTESAFEAEIPVLFLPSSNNSHYILLDELRERGLAPASVDLSDYMNKLNLRDKEETKSIAEVMKQLRELEKSEDIQKDIGKRINEFLQNRIKWAGNSVTAGKKFMTSLGGNGAKTVADKIEQMIEEKKL